MKTQAVRNVKLAALLACGLMAVGQIQAQSYITNVVCDFNNFNLSVTYNNWNPDGADELNGGTGYMPTITSHPSGYQVNAQGYGSGAYDFSSPLNFAGATGFLFTFTINSPTDGPYWMNIGVDISDGTHMVHLAADPASFPGASGGFLNYGNWTAGTYTLYGSLADQFGGGPLDPSTITAFNLELDPAGYGSGAPYDITYQNLSLITPVPEPSTWAMFGSGMAMLGFSRRFFKK